MRCSMDWIFDISALTAADSSADRDVPSAATAPPALSATVDTAASSDDNTTPRPRTGRAPSTFEAPSREDTMQPTRPPVHLLKTISLTPHCLTRGHTRPPTRVAADVTRPQFTSPSAARSRACQYLGSCAMLACQHLGALRPSLGRRRFRGAACNRAGASWDQRKCFQGLPIFRRLQARKVIGARHSVEMNPKAVCPMERAMPHIVSNRGVAG